SAMARPNGGRYSHSPAHETARKSPIATATEASAGHIRSQRIVHHARRTPLPRDAPPTPAATRGRAERRRPARQSGEGQPGNRKAGRSPATPLPAIARFGRGEQATRRNQAIFRPNVPITP